MADDEEKKIKLTVKTPRDKVELLVSPDSTVKEVSKLHTKVARRPLLYQSTVKGVALWKSGECPSYFSVHYICR